MKKIALVHYMPLEYYPPVMNMLDDLGMQDGLVTKVWSTGNIKGRNTYTNDRLIGISRALFPSPNQSKFFRLFTYLLFNVKVLYGLVLYNPNAVFYYESYSAGPVYWYLKLFGKRKKLFIHHHEYFDQNWYDNGMAIVRLYHELEKKYLFEKADWISHTNQFRIDLFLNDFPDLNPTKLHQLPNYPPDSWVKLQNDKAVAKEKDTLRIIYIGSISLEHTFIEEFCKWVISQNGRVKFDIYSFNYTSTVKNFLKKIDCEFINFFEDGIAYEDIPKFLIQYDIGVILYKASTLNAKYCASNKLFEYLVCGLEVWVSKEQEGTIPYLNLASRPRVKSINFSKMENDLIKDFHSSLSLPLIKVNYYYSSVSSFFIMNLLK